MGCPKRPHLGHVLSLRAGGQLLPTCEDRSQSTLQTAQAAASRRQNSEWAKQVKLLGQVSCVSTWKSTQGAHFRFSQ